MATTKKAAAPRKTVAPKSASPIVKKPATAPAKPKAAVKKPPAKSPVSKTVKAKTAKTVKPVKVEKVKKPKLVRDSFTIPKAEYVVLDALKLRAAKLTRPAKKSELLRAGIKALAALSDAAFLTALEQVPAIKTGRPASEK
ncbi:MAG: hypothetical protein V4573_04710 [Pseudomonadota bacterium]